MSRKEKPVLPGQPSFPVSLQGAKLWRQVVEDGFGSVPVRVRIGLMSVLLFWALFTIAVVLFVIRERASISFITEVVAIGLALGVFCYAMARSLRRGKRRD